MRPEHWQAVAAIYAEGIVYTPTSRVFEQFMSGPSPLAGTGATVTNEGVSVSASSNSLTEGNGPP